jgi:hypothetical protein
MKQIEERPSSIAALPSLLDGQPNALAFDTRVIYVVYTTPEETTAVLCAAAPFAAGLGVPVTVLHFREVPYAEPLDAPAGISPLETDRFADAAAHADVDVALQVYLCRAAEQAIGRALTRCSLVFLGQRQTWRRRSSIRLRRSLERAGHFVVAVDPSAVKEPVHA